MKNLVLRLITASVIAFGLQSHVALGQTGLSEVKAPAVPPNLQVPAGNMPYSGPKNSDQAIS